MTFIVTLKNGSRITYSDKYDASKEHERDAAWDNVNERFPDAQYIEEF